MYCVVPCLLLLDQKIFRHAVVMSGSAVASAVDPSFNRFFNVFLTIEVFERHKFVLVVDLVFH